MKKLTIVLTFLMVAYFGVQEARALVATNPVPPVPVLTPAVPTLKLNSTGKNVTQTEKDLKKLFPESLWNKLHLQIIYFGRTYCPARGHIKELCPICKIYGRKNMDR